MPTMKCVPVIRDICTWRDTPRDEQIAFNMYNMVHMYDIPTTRFKMPLHLRLFSSSVSKLEDVYANLDGTYVSASMNWSPVYDIDEELFEQATTARGIRISQYPNKANIGYTIDDKLAVAALVWDDDWNLLDFAIHHEIDNLNIHVDETKCRLYDSQVSTVRTMDHSISINNLNVIEPNPHMMPLHGGYWWVNPPAGTAYTNYNFGRGFTAVYWEPKQYSADEISDVASNLIDPYFFTNPEAVNWEDRRYEYGAFHVYEYVLNNQGMIPTSDPWDESKDYVQIYQPGDMLLGIAGNQNTYVLTDKFYDDHRPRVFNSILEAPRIRGKNCFVTPVSSNAINLPNNIGKRQWFLVHTIVNCVVRHRDSPEKGMWILPEPLSTHPAMSSGMPCFLAEPWTRVIPDFDAPSSIPTDWCTNSSPKWATRYLSHIKRTDGNYAIDPIAIINSHYALDPSYFETNIGDRPSDFEALSKSSANIKPRKFTPEIYARFVNAMWTYRYGDWKNAKSPVTDYTSVAGYWSNKFFTGYNIYPDD